MSNTVYHETAASVKKPLTWPPAIRAEHVEYLLAALPGSQLEIGPSVGHPRNWNRLHLPDGTTYCTSGGAWWHVETAEVH